MNYPDDFDPNDRVAIEGLGIRPVPSFTALPLEGPGRWAEIEHGLTLYTDDDNILFAKVDYSKRNGFGELIQALRDAYKAGETATQAFDRLRGEAPVVTGDLSELA